MISGQFAGAVLIVGLMAGLPSVASAEDAPAPIPACALSGSKSVFIGGAPALRLSDVVNCPPELYEIVPSVMIEGQPMVKFRTGVGEKGNCTARGEETVSVEGESASRLGDVACTQN
ncbi:PAAR domain-containing protein [Shinella zoogloeoides]|uniref:PAAR domain-containing protein n=1 Tax=Shinella zoogloeoides TaxID=352475 RepID=UPI00273DC6DB|nr:PAAR domain-containing protein [Shinella zoogloeoides]WLR91224.1 PAAR domain-containing protein [Shinella zoogloeoides]